MAIIFTVEEATCEFFFFIFLCELLIFFTFIRKRSPREDHGIIRRIRQNLTVAWMLNKVKNCRILSNNAMAHSEWGWEVDGCTFKADLM